MPSGDAAVEKAFAAEQRIAWVRFALVVLNTVLYFLVVPEAQAVPWLAYLTLAAVWVYSPYVLVAEPYRHYPVLRSAWFLTVTDAVIITAWIYATGGFDSGFYVLFYAAVVGIAYRFDWRTTAVVTVVYAGAYLGVLALAGELTKGPGEVAIRLSYLFTVAWLGALLGEEAYHQTQAKQELNRLNEATSQLTHEPRVQPTLKRTVDAAVDLLRADAAAAFVRNDETGEVTCPHAVNLSQAYVDMVLKHYAQLPGAGILEGNEVVHVPNVRHARLPDALVEQIEDEGLMTLAVFPLDLRDWASGAIAVYRRRLAPYSDDELELGRSLAAHATEALSSARLVEALASSEERWRSLVENAPNLVILLDDEGVVQFVNRTVTDRTVEEIVGTPMEVFVHEEDRASFREALGRVDTEGATVELEARGPAPEDPWAWYAIRMGPVESEDGSTLVIATDVTAYKELVDRLLASNEELQRFAHIASHDLKEPLRTISSYAQLLEARHADELTPQAREMLDFMVGGVHRMHELVRDLLTYSRVERDETPPEATSVDRVLDDVLEDLSERIEGTGATVTRDPLPEVLGRPSLLAQLFRNLLSNALKFHGDAPPRIHVSVKETPEGDRWRFEVTDEGIGIDAAYHDRIFTIFERLHGQDEVPGTGIGLAVCERIVQQHGANITVESTPGEGATFSFSLPAASSPGDELPPAGIEGSSVSTPGRGKAL